MSPGLRLSLVVVPLIASCGTVADFLNDRPAAGRERQHSARATLGDPPRSAGASAPADLHPDELAMRRCIQELQTLAARFGLEEEVELDRFTRGQGTRVLDEQGRANMAGAVKLEGRRVLGSAARVLAPRLIAAGASAVPEQARMPAELGALAEQLCRATRELNAATGSAGSRARAALTRRAHVLAELVIEAMMSAELLAAIEYDAETLAYMDRGNHATRLAKFRQDIAKAEDAARGAVAEEWTRSTAAASPKPASKRPPSAPPEKSPPPPTWSVTFPVGAKITFGCALSFPQVESFAEERIAFALSEAGWFRQYGSFPCVMFVEIDNRKGKADVSWSMRDRVVLAAQGRTFEQETSFRYAAALTPFGGHEQIVMPGTVGILPVVFAHPIPLRSITALRIQSGGTPIPLACDAPPDGNQDKSVAAPGR